MECRCDQPYRFRLSQEIVAVVIMALVVGGLQWWLVHDMVEEGRAARAAWAAESRQREEQARTRRAAWEADARERHDRARAEHEDFQRQMEAIRLRGARNRTGQGAVAESGEDEHPEHTAQCRRWPCPRAQDRSEHSFEEPHGSRNPH